MAPSLLASADPPPRNGTAMVVGGAVAYTVAVFGVLFPLMCPLIFPDPRYAEGNGPTVTQTRGSARTGCTMVGMGMTVLGVATGVPLLTIGAERMRAYRQWRREHRELGALLEHLQISAGGSRAGLSVTERF